MYNLIENEMINVLTLLEILLGRVDLWDELYIIFSLYY